ncbi:hypothetical protein ABEB36_012994 [Hypothenemus hampei]|uniref:Histone RNA hairpin-binding protein RNA-binding domain-containing protein n=1 Tax=Hypothenemus hampei TaxID=57062 RepID=A0ABD1E6F2_HYPHA
MEPRRLSMNTSLKNARIFDDDAWDDDGGIPKLKKELEETVDEINVKCELTNEENSKANEDFKLDIMKSITEESKLINEEENPIKPKTPPPPIISFEPVDKLFDESPYNKQLFNSWNIKEKTPLKSETDESTLGSCSSRRKVKRTVFTRPSPYKIAEPVDGNSEKILSVKSRLGLNVGINDKSIVFKKKTFEMETDPVVIARRQKQIEYGKNTIGYENYLKLVPKNKRSREDPKTPPKCGKYSRRGWEGLIKKWRINLHKYDPPEEDS